MRAQQAAVVNNTFVFILVELDLLDFCFLLTLFDYPPATRVETLPFGPALKY
jgi:hypothetical protein